jgi:hypothetical protein
LVQSKTAVKNRLHAHTHQGFPNESTVSRIKKYLVLLDTQILQIEQELNDPALKVQGFKKKKNEIL